MGLGFAFIVLIVAGISKVPFKNYVILNLIGGFIWTGILVCAGFFFGNIYNLISGPIKYVFVSVLLIIFIYIIRYINRYFKSKEI